MLLRDHRQNDGFRTLLLEERVLFFSGKGSQHNPVFVSVKAPADEILTKS